MTPAQEQEAFDMIWDGLTTQSKARPTSSPKGFVLGGQPGAGKSKMVSRLVIPPFLIELMGRKSKALLLFKNRWTTIY